MFNPQIIEKDLSCRSQHSQPIESVILDSNIPLNQRLLCKLCENISQPKMTIVEYNLLKQTFDEQQMEKIKKYELIMTPHINFIKQLKETITSLRTRLIQLLDYLLRLSEDWIKAISESITSYSFFEQLNNVTSLKETFIDSKQLIDKTRKMHLDWKIKINQQLDSFKHFFEFLKLQRLINDLESLTNKQEDQLKSQSIIKLPENQFITIIKQQIKTQPQGVLMFEDFIYKWIPGYTIYNRLKKQFSIQKTDKQIIYTSSEGEVIRSDQVRQQQEFLKKWEQILHLQWIGQYGQDGKKIGNWRATWKGETIQGIGGQYSCIILLNQLYKNGNKEGQWVDIIPNYSSEARAVEIGEYNANKRIGNWRYKFEEKQFDGGQYNQVGVKFGKWIELWEGFWKQSQITFNGEYNKNNMKVGRWDIMYCKWDEKEYKQVNILKSTIINYSGGGSYDQEGNQKKIGKWVELFEGFYYYALVTFNGEYNMNNMKVGRWDIMYDRCRDGQYKQIGGGSYDQEGTEKKIGKWVELDEGFYSSKQVTHNGGYNMNGVKVDRWDIIAWYYQIGGGSYDQGGNEKKIGNWIELDEGYYCDNQVTHQGEYNINGIKIGLWNLWRKYKGENELIGGGSYDQEGNQKKIGKWVELDEQFVESKQVTFNGEYNKNNMKVGRWDIMYCKWDEKEYKQIGGGSYDQEGNQKKIGMWVELFEGFWHNAQVTYNGEYNMNNIKVGRWDIMHCNRGEQEYKQMQKLMIYKKHFKSTIIYSGGGSYDQEGNQKKIGKWVELDEKFDYDKQVTYNGEYNMNGHKVGIWVEMDIDKNKKRGEKRYDN